MTTETDLNRLIRLVLKGWKTIVVLVVLFAASAFFYAEFMVVPTYTSSGKLAVYNRTGEAQTAVGGYNASDYSTSVKLVNTCIDIMKQPQFLDRVRIHLSDEDAAALTLGKISMSAVEETEILKLQVTDTNPFRAQRMVDAILKVAPGEIKQHIFVGDITSIYSATKAVPQSNRMSVKVFTGGMCGAVLALIIIFLGDLFNTTINSGDEISQSYGLPVLGHIPDCNKKKNMKERA